MLYKIKDRNEVVRANAGRELMNNMSEEEIAETRRILERLDRLATRVAQEFNFDKEAVMRDFIKDLQLIKNPSLVSRLDVNSGADMLTKQIVEEIASDPEVLNAYQNQALDYIMELSDDDAIRILSQSIPRLGYTARNQYLAHNEQRRLR